MRPDLRAAIVGIAGPDLTADEAALFTRLPPAGVILFARNIGAPAALSSLVGDLREVLPPESLLLVDHEGGRVARLSPPHWLEHPPAADIGELYEQDQEAGLRLAWLTGALIGLDCKEAGFDVVCAPVLDVLTPATTDAIGDRAYGADPHQVVALAQAMADGLLSAGIQPVGKHAPGHGKARQDSHHALPRIPATADLAPDISVFSACHSLPWMMTAHITYDSLDAHRPATLSPIVLEGVIRGAIGFNGVLVSDDLAMHALSGPVADRVRAALHAGCDLAMHCSGTMNQSSAALAAAPALSAATRARLDRARLMAENCQLNLDRTALLADRAEFIG